MPVPIWKDYIVDLGAPASAGAGVPFYIYSVPKAASIYSGLAYVKPGESTAKVRINDICADYIRNYFLEQPDSSIPAVAQFKVYATTSGSAVQKADVTFYNDWSYDPDYITLMGLSFPVVLTFGQNQFIPCSIMPGESVGTATIILASGRTEIYTPTKSRTIEVGHSSVTQYFGDPYVVPMDAFPGAKSVTWKGRTYLPSKACPQYALYYLNAYGGWDALPIEGRTVRSDAVDRFVTEQMYDNSNPTARGKVNFLNELAPSFSFRTGWLTDAQSARMHHLLNSPQVFVHDLESNTVQPIVLTGKTTEYKQYHGLLHSYAIEAELAQDRIRR